MADNRYTGKEEERGSFIGSVARTGAAIGGGVFAYRNRAAIAKGFSEVTSQASLLGSRVLSPDGHASRVLGDTKVLLSGISDSLGDNPSLLRTLKAGYDGNIQDKMRMDFEKSVRHNIDKRLEISNKAGKNRAEFPARFYRDFHKKEDGGLNKFQYAATKRFRENQVQKELAKKSAIKRHGGDKILAAVADFSGRNSKFLSSPADHIDDFMGELQNGVFSHTVKFDGKTDKNAFQKQMMETLEEYKSTQKVFKKNETLLNTHAQKFETAAAYGFIKDAMESTSKLGKQLGKRGFGTVNLSDAEKFNDALKRKHGLLIDGVDHNGKDVTVDTTKELRKFLNSHKNNDELKSLLGNNGIAFNFDDMALDPYLFKHSRTGEILDDRHLRDGVTKSLDAFQAQVKIPFLNINPLDLTPLQAMRSGQMKEGLHVLSAGQVHGFVRGLDGQTFDQAAKSNQLDAIRNPLKNSDHFYTGGNVWRLDEEKGLDLVQQDMYIVPSQFGAFSRFHKNATNLNQNPVDNRGGIKKTFDLGNQEADSIFTTYRKAWDKISDPMYGPNAMKSMAFDLLSMEEGQADRVRDTYNVLRVGIDKNTSALSREAAEVLSPHVNKLFDNIQVNGKTFDFSRLSDDDYVKDAAVVFNRELNNSSTNVNMYKNYSRSVYNDGLDGRESSNLYNDPAAKELQRWTKKYLKDPEGFAFSRQAEVERNLPMGFVVSSLGESEGLVTDTERLRRSFHQYALRALDDEAGDFTKANVNNGIRKRSSVAYLLDAQNKGMLSKKEIQNAKDLELLTDLLGYDNIHNTDARAREAKTFVDDLMKIQADSVSIDDRKIMFDNGGIELSSLGQDVQKGIERAQPIWGRAPEPAKPSHNNSDIILMPKNRALGKQGREAVSDLNLNIMNYGPVDDAWDLSINTEMMLRDTTPKLVQSGKDLISEMFAGRHRNSDNLEDVTTSTAIIYGLGERLDNQLTNFGLGLSQQNLGSFQSIIGNQFARRIAMPYMAYQQAVYFDGLTGDTVSDTLADGYVTTHSTIQGIKDVLGINKAMRPWANVFKQAGGADQIGEWVGVKQLDFLTFGMFSDFRSSDEVEEYYESGEDAIRKNRYWGIGSPSPWAGGGIDHYEANWYRKMKSDYQYTDTMYGDEGEYWSNHWMPTLTNPLAPIKHFITDPYHYEKKHEDDRPYAITGGFSEIQNIPLIGGVIDGTVGRILKPRKEHEGLGKAHKEYLSAINEYIQEQYSPVKDGTYIGVSGTGAVESFNMFADPGTGELFGGSAAAYGENAGLVNQGNAITGNFATSVSGGVSGGTSSPGTSSGQAMTGSEKTKSMLAADNLQLALAGKGEEVGPTSSLLKLRNMAIESDMDDMDQVDSLKGQALDAFYSASELSGIYGFLTKTGIGYDESWRGTTLASSSLMTSPNRAFWDMNLGGMGGSLSEIGRRYIPRDPNKDYYSPIRNTMPEWLPGIEESTDFLHGDPYVKIQKGEMRLPGKAYETLYKLHPDGTGSGDFANYGVFDRFRILADVAPDSEQYKVAKHQISLLRQAGGITEDMDSEINEIEKQVHDKQDTYRWYDKKFSNADINKETVTIEKVIDANTFKVREYDNPIKFAGIKLTQTNNQDVIDWLGQYMQVGEKIKIGLTEDPASRVNNDTYKTMSAVVYSNKNEEGRFWYETNKGQSLNALIANRTWENKVQIKDDGSAANTRALYSNDMVTVGKYMEFVTHDVLPKIPFVGILADKFLQVRTPIESYKRDQVYGTDWRPWQHPYEGWIKPMVNTVTSQNPLVAGAEMAAIGHMFAKEAKGKGIGRIAGFAIGAGMSSLRVFDEAAESVLPWADGVWMPKEREKEREINQYFDRLKYVKYRGLYEKARELALSKEGVDVEDFLDRAAEKGELNKGLKRFLTDKKRMLSFSKKMGYGDAEAVDSQVDEINTGLEDIQTSRDGHQAGQYTSLAMRYRKEYEGTLYGMGEFGASDRTALMRALTPKEREYIPRFLETTSTKERQQILKYVPEDVRRILQGSWGLKVDKQEDIEDYFDGRNLPGQDWVGWNASTNLDDVKIKVMQKAGINPTLSGYWGKDQARAEQQGAKAIPINSLSSLIDSNRITEVLLGLGLSDVDVQLTTSYGNGPGGVNTSMDIVKDVKGDILDTMNAGMHSLF